MPINGITMIRANFFSHSYTEAFYFLQRIFEEVIEKHADFCLLKPFSRIFSFSFLLSLSSSLHLLQLGLNPECKGCECFNTCALATDKHRQPFVSYFLLLHFLSLSLFLICNINFLLALFSSTGKTHM